MIHDDDDPGMDDALSPGLRSLLDDGAEGPAMSGAARDRLLGRVLATVAVTTVAGASAASAASVSSTTTAATTTAATTATATTGITSALVFKATLAVALAVATVGIGIGVAGSRSPSPVSVPSALATAPTAPTAPPTVQAPVPPVAVPVAVPVAAPVAVPVPEPVAVAAKAKKPEPLSSSPPAPSPAWEVAQLEAARVALSRGGAAEALGLLSELARRAPRSSLAEERETLMVLALAGAGRLDEARAAAQQFGARYPDSLFLDRVRASVR
jgi:hypothetical protein